MYSSNPANSARAASMIARAGRRPPAANRSAIAAISACGREGRSLLRSPSTPEEPTEERRLAENQAELTLPNFQNAQATYGNGALTGIRYGGAKLLNYGLAGGADNLPMTGRLATGVSGGGTATFDNPSMLICDGIEKGRLCWERRKPRSPTPDVC
jgi:hypothetical protein